MSNRSKSTPRTSRTFSPHKRRILELGRHRGRLPTNVWYQYSPKLQADVVVGSDLAFHHFCWLEGNSEIRSYELHANPITLSMHGEARQIAFDILVRRRHGADEIHEFIRTESAEKWATRSRAPAEPLSADEKSAVIAAGLIYVAIDREWLAAHRILCVNWQRVLPIIAATRRLDIQPYLNEMLLMAQCTPRFTVGDLLARIDKTDHAVWLSALFTHVQQGEFSSDLDSVALSDRTLVWKKEAPHA